MKNFSIQFGGLEGQHVTEHRLPLCLISHFLYSSERVLTLKDVPSTLARSLVEVIAQHTNQKAKLKKRKQQQQKLWVFIVYYHLLNHEVFPYCPVVFQAISVGSKKKKKWFLNLLEHYLRAIWKSGNGLGLSGRRGISRGIQLGRGSVFCCNYRQIEETCPFWFSRSSFHVFSCSELNISLEKENIEETWEGEPTHLYFSCKNLRPVA